MGRRKIIRQSFLILLAVFFGKLSSEAWAIHPGMGTVEVENSAIPMSFHPSIEYLWGESSEYVYRSNTGRKISQLDWELKDIVLIGGTVKIRPASWLQINFGIWAAVNEGNGYMVDRDWLRGNLEWSHWSRSQAIIDKGYIFDLNAGFPFDFSNGFTLSPMIGFKFDNWGWSDRGGEYIYSNPGWRDDSGQFTDETAICYEQQFFAPYLGLNIGFSKKKFFFNTYVKGSFWAWSRDEDQHLVTNVTYEGQVNNQNYIGAGLELGYHFNRRFYMLIGYDYQRFFETRGGLKEIDGNTNKVDYSSDGAGISHLSNAIFFALGYQF